MTTSDAAPADVRAARRARRRALRSPCTECGHPWSEHPGTPYDAATEDGLCGECAYEQDHGFAVATAACRLQVPAAVLDVP